MRYAGPSLHLAHEVTEQVRSLSAPRFGLCVAAAAAGLVVLVAARVRFARAEVRAKSKYQREQARRGWVIGSAAGALLLLGGVAAAPFFGFETTEESVSHQEVEVTSSARGSELPVEFTSAAASGSVEIVVANPNDVAVHAQCVFETLDAGGENVAEGGYTQFDEEGESFGSDTYSNRFVILPEGDFSFGADIGVTGVVAEYRVSCTPIPFTEQQLEQLREDGVPPMEFPRGSE